MHIHTFTQTLAELKILRRTNKGLISLLLPFSGDVNWGQEHYGVEFPHDMIYRLENGMHRTLESEATLEII